MQLKHPCFFDDLDFKFQINGLEINILYIHFMPSNPNWNEKKHSHSSYELHFIPRGKGILITNEREYQITEKTFYLTGPGIYHEQRSDKENPMEEYCINFEIKKLKTAKTKNTFPKEEMKHLSEILLETKFWFGRDEYDCVNLFERIYTEFEEKWIGFYASIHNYLSQIIINSIRCFMQQKKAVYKIPHKTLDETRIIILDTYLYINYHEHITMDVLADKMGVSKRQLYRIVKQYYHTSLKEKLISIRIDHAKNLLLNSDFSLEVIAEKVGFSSASHLSTVFKKQEKMAPNQFRKHQDK